MKFGFTIPTYTNRPPSPEHSARTYRLCQTAEELGFDFAMVGSHRFSAGATDPSAPFVLLSAVAARTSALRLATLVLVLPLFDPLAVAEQVATLDGLSDGRAILGVGVGYRRYEYEALGLSWNGRGTRLEEGVEVLRQAWGPAPVCFEGRHFRFDGVQVLPKPAQEPGPPIWIGAQGRTSIARAGTHGDGWTAGYLESLPVLAPRIEAYRSAARGAGRESAVCLMRKTGIRATRAEVEEDWMPGVLDLLRGYRDAGARWPGDSEFWAAAAGAGTNVEGVARDRMVIGTPEDCIAEIERIEALTGCEYFLPSFGTAGRTDADDAQLAEDVALFGREVIPAFR